VRTEHIRYGRDQGVRVARRQPAQHGQQREIRHDAGEDARVLDLAGHQRAGDIGPLEDIDAPAQLTQRDPVKISRRPGGRRRFHRWTRFLANRDHGDFVTEAAGGIESQEWKLTVACNQADAHVRLDVRATRRPRPALPVWPAGEGSRLAWRCE